MKFLVVGHLCHDVIHPVNGAEVESYGGIYYAVTALASLLESDDTVIPVFGVNKNDYPKLIEHLSSFPNIDSSGIYKFDEPTNHVHLYYSDGESRVECSKDIAKPIPFEKVRRLLPVDGILVNMISGFDIAVETLDNIRMAVRERKTPIHFDYHSLTLGVRENSERFRRPIQDWRRWVFMTDTVQLNEEEIGGLTVEKLSEERTVGHLLTLSVKGVLVTRGERGVSLFYNEHKHVVRKDVEGLKVDRLRDSTGCGDVFGAAFLMHNVRTGDMFTAAQFANKVAASKARMVGAKDMQTLRENLVVG